MKLSYNKTGANTFARLVEKESPCLRLASSVHINSPTQLKPYEPSIDFMQIASVDQNIILTNTEIDKFLKSNAQQAQTIHRQYETQKFNLTQETALNQQSKMVQAKKKQSVQSFVQQYAKSHEIVEQPQIEQQKFQPRIKEEVKPLAPNLRDANIRQMVHKDDKSWQLEEQVRQMALQKHTKLQNDYKKKKRINKTQKDIAKQNTVNEKQQ